MTQRDTPTAFFDVVYADGEPLGAAAERRFAAHKEAYGSLLACHGSSAENFHSILHNGLASHLNKARWLA